MRQLIKLHVGIFNEQLQNDRTLIKRGIVLGTGLLSELGHHSLQQSAFTPCINNLS